MFSPPKHNATILHVLFKTDKTLHSTLQWITNSYCIFTGILVSGVGQKFRLEIVQSINYGIGGLFIPDNETLLKMDLRLSQRKMRENI